MTATLTRHADRLTLACECRADADRMARLWQGAFLDGRLDGAIPAGCGVRVTVYDASVVVRDSSDDGHDGLSWAESALCVLVETDDSVPYVDVPSMQHMGGAP